MVMFGGRDAAGPLGDTWEWDGLTWTNAAAAVSPSPRWESSIAYDAARGNVVLFGGGDNSTSLGDTWTWDGLTWTQRVPVVSPAPRHGAAMTYDDARQRVVLFGGADYANNYFADTWEWDGQAWSLVVQATPPQARWSPAMAWDSARGIVVLHGGIDGRGSSDPSAWLQDTWIRASPPPASLTLFGQGCVGPAGLPQLTAVAGSRPIIGQTLHVQIDNVPVSILTLPIGAVGFSNQAFGVAPLPAALDALGAPGCTLFISIDQEFVLSNQSGHAAWNLAVPFNQSLIGLNAFMQGAVVVPGFNCAGLVFTNAARAVVGSR
jgi:hypothetical protein